MNWWRKWRAERLARERALELRNRVDENERLRSLDTPEWQKPAPLNTVVRQGYPDTFIAPNSTTPPSGAQFDPALKQFERAFRNTDPSFTNADDQQLWRGARRSAMDHVLSLVATDPLGSQLSLRGSRLLSEWFGDQAREPGDLDFVAPQMWNIDAEGKHLQRNLVAACSTRTEISDGLALTGEARFALLWTYDRVPGYRLVFPWRAEASSARSGGTKLEGQVQVDIVFGEATHEQSTLQTLRNCSVKRVVTG